MFKKILIAFFSVFFFIFAFSRGLKNFTNDKTDEKKLESVFNNVGVPYYSYFSNEKISDKEIFSIQQDTLGRYILASKRGINIFDGNEYLFCKTSGMPYKLAKDPYNQRIFIACNNSIGYLANTDSNCLYVEISNKIKPFVGDVSIFFNKDFVYFYYKNFIISYDKINNTEKFIETPDNTEFSGIITYENEFYVLISGKGFSKITDIDSNLYPEFPFSISSDIVFSFNLDNKTYFANSDNQIFVFSDDIMEEVEFEKIEYLENKIISGAEKISENIIAIATLNGGVAFFNTQSLKIVSVLNVYTGLPDNEVFAIFKDNENGLVITNNYGIFRYEMSLPIKNYGLLPGVEGKIVSTILKDSTIYLLTTQGLYYLAKAESEQEFEKIIMTTKTNNNANQNIQIQPDFAESENDINSEIKDQNTENDDTKKESKLKQWSKNLFGKDKKNKNNKNNDVEENNIIDNQNDTISEQIMEIKDSLSIEENIIEEKPVHVIVKKKAKINKISDFYYFYKKIQGIDSKCKQALNYKNSIIVSSNNGLYLVENQKSKCILKDEYITYITKSTVNDDLFFIATANMLYSLEFKGDNYVFDDIISTDEIEDYILSVTDDYDNIWLGGEGYAYKIPKSEPQNFTAFSLSNIFLAKVDVQKIQNNIHFFIPHGIFKYNTGLDSIVKYYEFSQKDADNVYFINSQNDYIWTKTTEEWKYVTNKNKLDSAQIKLLNIIPKITDIIVDENDNLWVISDYINLYKISRSDSTSISENFRLNSVFSINNKVIKEEKTTIDYQENLKLNVKLQAPYFISNDEVFYQYAVSKNLNSVIEWSDEKNTNSFDFHLTEGKYYFYFRAINATGKYSNVQKIEIKVKPPFWQTDWFKLLISLSIIILLFVFFAIRQKTLKKQKENLEKIVQIRTAEIEKRNEELKVQSEEIISQNEEIKQQNEELKTQSEEINRQNKILTEKSEEINRQNELLTEQRNKIQESHLYITQSINYARRIQTAILPTEKILTQKFEEYFILSLPKDIVSGDFYWFKEHKNKLYLTVADCTGHGVPGAFLSMLGTAYLNEIINYKENIKAGEILDNLRVNIIYALQEKHDNGIRDGMDMSMLIFDENTKKIEFAGAYNPAFVIRNNDLIVLEADKMPIGYSRKNNEYYRTQSLEIQKDDIIYAFSDGFVDQFGGKNGRKFLISNFKKLLLNIADAPLKIQKELLVEAFAVWKGDYFQIDDITIIGLKIK